MLVIDGENCVLGRLASEVAKKALNGEEIKIMNAEKILIIGNPTQIVEDWKAKFRIKNVAKPEVGSPKFSRRPDLFVKRSIRGMLPRKSERGKKALKKIKVFLGKIEGVEKAVKIAEVKDVKRFISVGDLCKQIGWKG